MTSENRLALDVWSEFKLLVEQLETEMHKNAVKGNAAAGVRVRKGVRKLRSLGSELIKATLAGEQARKEEKAAASTK